MKTIAIVGGGFTGTALAVQLMRRARSDELKIVLIERSQDIARGVAYRANDAEALLNVPAGNMSLFLDQPSHFVDYCNHLGYSITPNSFVRRAMYGDYLESTLKIAVRECVRHCTFVHVVAEVVAIRPGEIDGLSTSVILELDGEDSVTADHVVLATGNSSPLNLPLTERISFGHERYIRDPWAPGVFAGVPPDASVLLVGTGLTAVDVAVQLFRTGASRQCLAVSRRGLTPQTHRTREGATGIDPVALASSMGSTVRTYVRTLRAAIRSGAVAGADWRDVLGDLRPYTTILWQRLTTQDRQRFLRHLRAYWDVHRHRTAPASHAQFRQLIGDGKLRLIAGRIIALHVHGKSIHVEIRQRGKSDTIYTSVDYVVNCTGPDFRLDRMDEPLIRQLLTSGELRMDTTMSGVEVDDDYRLMGRCGRSNYVSYVGPMLRARYWEATAVPELRGHVERLAGLLVA